MLPLKVFTSPAQPLTIADAVALYLSHLQSRVRDGTYTQKRYNQVEERFRLICDFVGPLALVDARQFHLTHWLESRERWSAGTRRDAAEMIVAGFTWLADEEAIERSPFRRVKIKVVPSIRPPVMREHYRALRVAARGHYARHKAFRRAIYFLWRTGCRPGEMRNLKWSDIDIQVGVAILTHHKTAHHGHTRKIVLTKSVRRLLRVLPRTSEYVFVNARGKPMSGPTWEDDELGKDCWGAMFKRWAKRCNLPEKMSSHCIRCGWTVRGIKAGETDRAIADVAGWSTTRMVSHYGKGSREDVAHLQGVAERIERS